MNSALPNEQEVASRCNRRGSLLLAICLAATPIVCQAQAGGADSAPLDPLAEQAEAAERNRLSYSAKLDDYQDAIARLEAEQGAWSPALAEQLSGLGESYQLRGQHRDAVEIFDRAIHVSRINNGLYDLSQAPIIESMVESLKARGRWEEVHERHQYLYWLYKRNFGDDDPRMLPIIDRLGKWYINDYALNPDRRMMSQLVDAHNLFRQAVDIISGNFGDDDLRLIEPLRGLVMSNWFFSNYRGESGSLSMERDQHAFSMAAEQVNFPNESPDNRLTQYLRNNYLDGKKALEQMVEIYSQSDDSPKGAAAMAKVELADWEQLFERRRSAGDLYKQAYQELASEDSTRRKADKLFSQPVALPAMDFIDAEVDEVSEASENPEAEPNRYVLVSFDVNRFGQAQRIEIIESYPKDDTEHRSRVKRSLESTRFRPRIVDGQAVDTQGLTQKYVFTGD